MAQTRTMKADSPALLYCNGAAEVRSHNPLNGVAQLPIYTAVIPSQMGHRGESLAHLECKEFQSGRLNENRVCFFAVLAI